MDPVTVLSTEFLFSILVATGAGALFAVFLLWLHFSRDR